MRLSPNDDGTVGMFIERIRLAIDSEGGGDGDLRWALGKRLSEVLAAQAYESVADKLCLACAKRSDTPIEILIDGKRCATYEAETLRTEIWLGLIGSIHSVFDLPELRKELMARDALGEDALPNYENQRDECSH